MATRQVSHGQDQFLRRTFDTVYSVDVIEIWRTVVRLPRRTKWMGFASIGILILAMIAVQLIQTAAQAAYQASLPTALEMLEAPYGLGEDYFTLDTGALPEFAGYTQAPIELANLNAHVACVADVNTCTEAQLFNYVPMSSGIAAEYQAGEAVFRVTALRFGSEGNAQNALYNLYDYHNANNAIGNYVLMPSQPVRYFYSAANGWLHFTVAVESDLYTITAASVRQLNEAIELLRTAPPVITEGVVSG